MRNYKIFEIFNLSKMFTKKYFMKMYITRYTQIHMLQINITTIHRTVFRFQKKIIKGRDKKIKYLNHACKTQNIDCAKYIQQLTMRPTHKVIFYYHLILIETFLTIQFIKKGYTRLNLNLNTPSCGYRTSIDQILKIGDTRLSKITIINL